MSRTRITVMILACLATLPSAVALANSSYGAVQSEASALYEAGDYAKAYKQYLKLGKKGDRLAQYRVSYMTLKGLGTRADVIESLAWASLAAFDGPADLAEYRATVAALVPQDRRKKANQKVGYYLRRYGDMEEAEDQDHLGHCTGSRLAAKCNPDDSRKTWVTFSRVQRAEQDLMQQIEKLNREIENEAASLNYRTTGG